MISYNLASALKEAGFPQPKDYIGDTSLDMGIIPTLVELIEACGDKFESLKFDIDNPKCWIAESRSEIGYDKERKVFKSYCEIGDTPEEAVANLWLALNKKDENNPSSDK